MKDSTSKLDLWQIPNAYRRLTLMSHKLFYKIIVPSVLDLFNLDSPWIPPLLLCVLTFLINKNVSKGSSVLFFLKFLQEMKKSKIQLQFLYINLKQLFQVDCWCQNMKISSDIPFYYFMYKHTL